MNFTQREKLLVGFAAVFLITVAAFFGFRYFTDKFLSIDERIQEKAYEASQIEKLGKEYEELQRINPNDAGESLSIYIENALQQLNLTETTKLVPSELSIKKQFLKKMVKVQFNSKVPARTVLELINKIENEKGHIYRIESFSSAKDLKKKGYYSFRMIVASYDRLKKKS